MGPEDDDDAADVVGSAELEVGSVDELVGDDEVGDAVPEPPLAAITMIPITAKTMAAPTAKRRGTDRPA
jgi:hypothetical protein